MNGNLPAIVLSFSLYCFVRIDAAGFEMNADNEIMRMDNAVVLTTKLPLLVDKSCEIANHTMTCAALPAEVPGRVTEVFVTDQRLLYDGIFSHKSWRHVVLLSLQAEMIEMIHGTPFVGLENMTELRLVCIHLKTVSKTVLVGLERLTKLELLDMRYIRPSSLQDAFVQPDVLPSLQELVFNLGQPEELPEFNVDASLVKGILDKPLLSLNFSWVILNIEVVQLLRLYEDTNVKILNISNSVIVLDVENEALNYININALKTSRVFKVFDMSGVTVSNRPYHRIADDRNVRRDAFLTKFITSIENIYANNFDHFIMMGGSPYNFTERQVYWKTLHFRNNNLFLLNKTELLNQNNTVELVDLSVNKLQYISPLFASTAIHVKQIYLSSNRLGNMQQNPEFSNLFQTFHELEIIDLSDNGFFFLPFTLFQNNTQLKMILIANNYLTSITFDMKNLMLLEFLDLSSNKIHTISGEKLSSLETYVRLKLQKTKTPLLISFVDNPLQCSCEHLPFIQWLARYSNAIGQLYGSSYCSYEGKTITIDSNAVKKTEYLCKRQMIIISSVSASVGILMLFLVTAYCAFRIRRKIKQSSRRERFIADFADGRIRQQHMAFVAYAIEDEDRVSRNFLLHAEQLLCEYTSRQCRHNMVQTGNHFRPGCLIVHEMYRLIDLSCVFVAMVSNEFCAKEFCKAELQEACKQNKPIILVFLDHVDEVAMSPYLQEVFKRNSRAKLVRRQNGDAYFVPSLEAICDSMIHLAAQHIFEY